MTTWPVTAGAAGGGRRLGLVGRDQHQPDAALRRRRKFLRLEPLAVDVRRRLDRGAGRHVVELRAAALVGLHRLHLRADVQLDRMAGDVVRELAANQTDRDRAVRQIVDRPRDARHLLRVGHREAARLRVQRLRTEDTEDNRGRQRQQSSERAMTLRARPCPCAESCRVTASPARSCRTCASASFAVAHDAQTRSAEPRARHVSSARRRLRSTASPRSASLVARVRWPSAASPSRFAGRVSICSR